MKPFRPHLPTIQDKVRFLSQADAYPNEHAQIEVKETHMSWVFLGEQFVYKLKKPVILDVMNFTTIAARRENCEREVRLNRRLAEDVYLGMMPLTLQDPNQLALGGEGKVVDWLVKMRRVPQDRMLDVAILANTVTDGDIMRVSQLLTNFYQHIATPIAVQPDRYWQRFEQSVARTHQDLCKTEYAMSLPQIQRLTDVQKRFLEEQGLRLKQRAEEGRIVEAHGDLRPEHICLMPKPVIIDCLEFDKELRTLDPVDELAYLAMECERLAAPLIGKKLLQQYVDAIGDQPPEWLVSFYKIYRACLRAKIALRHLDDPQLNDHEKWRNQARQYLGVADRYCSQY